MSIGGGAIGIPRPDAFVARRLLALLKKRGPATQRPSCIEGTMSLREEGVQSLRNQHTAARLKDSLGSTEKSVVSGSFDVSRPQSHFAPGRGELLQLLSLSLSPCCRFHPAEVMVPCRSDFGTPCCLHPTVAGSVLGSTHFRGHFHVHCRYGPVTRDLPKGDLVDRLQDLGFPPPCYPNYGAPDCCPGGFISR